MNNIQNKMQKYEDEIELPGKNSENKNQGISKFDEKYQNTNSDKQKKSKYTIDEIYRIINHKGRYQKRTAFLMSLSFFVTTILLVSPAYLFQVPQFHCLKENGDLHVCYENNGACEKNSQINKESYDSISLEFELYCEKQEIRDSGESILYIGAAIGLLIFNQLADIKGRKIAIQISWIIFTIGAIIVTVSNSVKLIMAGFLLCGGGAMPAITVELVYLNEISTGKFRQAMVISMYIMWGITEMIMLPLAEISSSWRMFFLIAVTIPGCVLNVLPFLICETPKFYLSKEKRRVIQSLQFIQRINKTEQALDIHLDMLSEGQNSQQQNQQQQQEEQQNQKIYSYIDLFRYPSVRTNMILFIIFSVALHLLYYGTNFIVSRIGIEFQYNVFFIGIAETLGYIASERLCEKLKRKKWAILTLIISIMIMYTTQFFDIPEECEEPHKNCVQKDLNVFLITFARFVVAFTFSLLVLWGNESFPTTVRSVGLGLLFGIGILGGFLSPYVVDLSYDINLPPVLTIGIIGFLGSLSSLGIKETLGIEPPDQIQETLDEQNSQLKSFEKRVINFGPDVKDVVH